MRVSSCQVIRVALVFVLIAASGGAAGASGGARFFDPGFAERARSTDTGRELRIGGVPLSPASHAALEGHPHLAASSAGDTLRLRRIDVFTGGAKIVLHRDGREEAVAAPETAYFAGAVEGRPGSFAFLSIEPDARMRGLVSDGETLWVVGAEDGVPEVHALDPEQPPTESAAAWGCGNEGSLEPPGAPSGSPLALAEQVLTAATADAGTLYQADVAVETDAEFHDLFSSTEEAIAYVGDLFAAMSAIYERDVGAVLRVSHLSLWPDGSGSDPWNATSTMNGLNEFMADWRANHGDVSRTVAHFLSGKRTGGGVAYVGVLCSSWYGYGFTGSLNGRFSTTTPWLFWDILGVSHELGHNFGSGHTHCYSPPVDECYGSQSGCHAGSTSVPSDGGTIMSYCHLRSGGYGNINLWFGRDGQYGDDSLRVPDLMRARVESAWCMGAVQDPPVVSLDAVPAAIEAGQTTTLSWSSADADTCAFVQGLSQAVETSGAVEVTPPVTTEYVVECTGGGGTTSASVTVDVTRPRTTLSIEGGILRVVGPAHGATRLVVRRREVSGELQFEVIDRKTEIVVVEGTPCVENRGRYRCPAAGISSIEVLTGSGRDRVTIRGSIPARVETGAGDDVLRGGDGPDLLIGGPGRDRLYGRDGNDELQGDADADRLDGGNGDDQLQGGLGPDVMIGRSGTDTAVYVGRDGPISATMDDVADDGEAGEGDDIRSSVELVSQVP